MVWCCTESKAAVQILALIYSSFAFFVGVIYIVAAWRISVAIEHYRRPYVWVTGGVDGFMQFVAAVVLYMYKNNVASDNQDGLLRCYTYLICQMLGNLLYSTATFLRYMFIESSTLAEMYRTITFPDPVPPTARMTLTTFWAAVEGTFLMGFSCYHDRLKERQEAKEKKKKAEESTSSSEEAQSPYYPPSSPAGRSTAFSPGTSKVATPFHTTQLGRAVRVHR
ncbi:uncharacterized protein LOC135370206 [Ornithodoros turicata]|uniref:uncharacterized protein LOC135370206 n=1 Tax=Ornithodoros turicata TaxID=34597 RepID=UPI0031390436